MLLSSLLPSAYAVAPGSLGQTVWPIPGATVARGFDLPDENWQQGHRGVDLGVPAGAGATVRAVASGRVSVARVIVSRGVVTIDHGELRTTYEPVRPLVTEGDWVETGQPIGVLEGQHLGCQARACLHLGLRRGEDYLDPLAYLSPDAALGGPVRLLDADAPRRARESAADRRASLSPGMHGFVWPVEGPVTSAFGMRTHPVTGVHKLHDGLDLGAACGTPVTAPYPGTVTRVEWHDAYGWRVFVDHALVGGRMVVTSVNHLQSTAVRPGQQVELGEPLGQVGSTGLSTGCHLHLMLWLEGELTDPASWW